ncbi:class I SAM-dependent methyltransferase [Gloeobacter kilaueensis]|uniref:Methylase involved in ubiquinone/menaquinone biosynthesis n=1 Tax=Gloeobacter kilaueensis (strain ATCC BAA-2537 / CCAP 1431/1 / ULC 316 / JS1) TaxID=1183438 RepID=U5QHU1_GLOK1|nr:class I SAM-dependent methyltransferase [Gloeobacter kilaueensis]AGY58491.1 methylase involved in ubiquinone/menaquinone biosynthesis [Gloeobacter kilaueensis JS1]
MLQALAEHREREHSGRNPLALLPDEVQALPFWREVVSGKLRDRLGLPFWQLVKPKKNDRCLYINCGPSFLTDPWVEWGALFWGLDLDGTMVRAVRARAPRLNSKLFKDMQEGAPHDLDRYSDGQFDCVIAAGFSFFLPQVYDEQVLTAIRRVLKPEGHLLWEAVNPASPWFEDWSIGQMYLGLEVVTAPALTGWQSLLSEIGPVRSRKGGELFELFDVARL